MGIMVQKRQMFCAVLGIAAAGLAFFVDNSGWFSGESYVVERNDYGQGAREEEWVVDGLEADKVTVTLSVEERSYTEEEAKRAMDAAAEELPQRILGENISLEEVRSPLSLVSWLEEYGIAVEWETADQGLIGSDGIVTAAECPESGKKTQLTARLQAGGYHAEYMFPITVYPPARTGEEQRRERFLQLLQQMEESQRTEESFLLPREYEGRELHYRGKLDRTFLIFPVLGAAVAVLLPFLEKQKEQEKRKTREQSMLLDYPEIVSKLVVFTGAGLPVRRAWERIVWEYEKKGGKERAAYEEMAAAYHRMQRGVPELAAYAEFGRRCGLLPYRKLSGLLEQNVKKGSESLRLALEEELENAFEQQKVMVRRMGEEASAKLLAPLFLLLAVVMILVSVPAFLSFGL